MGASLTDRIDIMDSQTAGRAAVAAKLNSKLVSKQVVVTYDQFTDGGGTSGTLDCGINIPAGADFLKTCVTAITGFTGDSSATIKVGDGSTADRYNTGTPSVFTTAAAGVDMGVPSGTKWHTAATNVTITITSGTDWGQVTAGKLTLTVWYYDPTDTDNQISQS